jgi:hypothetical protein
MLLSNGAPDVHFAEAPSGIRKNALAEAEADASAANRGGVEPAHEFGTGSNAWLVHARQTRGSHRH